MLTLIRVVPDDTPNSDGYVIRSPARLDPSSLRWHDVVEQCGPYVPEGHHMVDYEPVGYETPYVFYMSWLHGLIYDLAWPRFECLQCLGQEEWRGCECAHKDAVAPCIGPEPWRVWARRLWSVVARRCGLYDPYERSW